MTSCLVSPEDKVLLEGSLLVNVFTSLDCPTSHRLEENDTSKPSLCVTEPPHGCAFQWGDIVTIVDHVWATWCSKARATVPTSIKLYGVLAQHFSLFRIFIQEKVT